MNESIITQTNKKVETYKCHMSNGQGISNQGFLHKYALPWQLGGRILTTYEIKTSLISILRC